MTSSNAAMFSNNRSETQLNFLIRVQGATIANSGNVSSKTTHPSLCAHMQSTCSPGGSKWEFGYTCTYTCTGIHTSTYCISIPNEKIFAGPAFTGSSWNSRKISFFMLCLTEKERVTGSYMCCAWVYVYTVHVQYMMIPPFHEAK